MHAIKIMSILVFVILIISTITLVFLSWIEIFPLKKWVCTIRAKAIGIRVRFFVEILNIYAKIQKWIDCI
mgnify:CR=1 FL=1